MKDKNFYLIIAIICIIGIIVTFFHLRQIITLQNDLSITSFISNEK